MSVYTRKRPFVTEHQHDIASDVGAHPETTGLNSMTGHASVGANRSTTRLQKPGLLIIAATCILLVCLGRLLSKSDSPQTSNGNKVLFSGRKSDTNTEKDGNSHDLAKQVMSVKQLTAPLDQSIGQLKWDVPGRLVAIGDLHGDHQALIRALKLANVVDEKLTWNGGDTVVVQMGDNLDRGDTELEVLSLIVRLQREAITAGGAFHVILGNHEIMNAELDFRFVDEAGFLQFDKFMNMSTTSLKLDSVQIPKRMIGRVEAFRPGGSISSTVLAARNVAIILRDSIFVHAGLVPEYINDLNEINSVARAFLKGSLPIFNPEAEKYLANPQGPLWTRRYSMDVSDDVCEELQTSLTALNVSRLVVGHTVQPDGITSACNGLVWRIDIGMGASFAGFSQRQMQLIEIFEGGKVDVLHEA